MHFFWFLVEHFHFVCFFLVSYFIVQCKPKKKFQGDSRVQLVEGNTPMNAQSKKGAHRPVSQAVPKSMPVEKTKVNVNDDTLANVASIAPDVSTGAPPKV